MPVYHRLKKAVFDQKLTAREFDLKDPNTETLAADKTLALTDGRIQFLDPNNVAGRDVNLPAEADSVGLLFLVVNRADGAENLVVKNDGGGTIVTVSQNEAGLVVCDGVTWSGLVGANT